MGGANGEREFGLGLRPHSGRHGEPRLQAIRPNGWQYSAAPWYSACTGAQAHNNLDRLHPRTYVCPCGHRLFLCGGTDAGLITYYVPFFIRLERRQVEVAGITQHPNEAWMKQIARNVTMDEWGFLDNCRYLIHDRDPKFCQSYRDIIESGDVKTLPLPARSLNLNAFAERWVKSVKEEALSKLILVGEASLRRVLNEYVVHFHAERNHQGKGNVLLFPTATRAKTRVDGSVACKERLGGLLKYYHRDAA